MHASASSRRRFSSSARAGLTERTFFRHFADKREVLFSGAELLKEILSTGVASAPEGTSPLAAVTRALEATSSVFEERRDWARQRQALIEKHPELHERELIKLASLVTALAEALRRRGVAEPTANLASEVGVAVFKSAFERWVHDAKARDFTRHVRESLRVLQAVIETPAAPSPPRKPSPAKPAPTHEPRRKRR
jgi:AcrR family transcriptional regulator